MGFALPNPNPNPNQNQNLNPNSNPNPNPNLTQGLIHEEVWSDIVRYMCAHEDAPYLRIPPP